MLLSAITALLFRQAPMSRVHIYQNGTLIETVELYTVTEPYTITVDHDEGTNIIAVEQGRVRVLTADCPNRMCVRRGWISGGVVPIVCLPHRLVISLEGSGDSDIDAIVG